jgi:hypothetical protein
MSHLILSSLNITGLRPSVQQFMVTPSSLIQGKLQPSLSSRMLLDRAIQVVGQNPCGMTKFSTVNSWPVRNTSHGPVGAISVTGLVWNTSDGFVRFKTVILTFTVSVK